MLVKFSPAGQVLATIGRRDALGSLGSAGPGIFHGRNEMLRPRDRRRVDRQGNIFVTDGYFDTRVVKFDKSGHFLKAVGKQGPQPEFNTRTHRHRLPGQRLRG